MNQKELSASNPSPNTHADDDKKTEAARRVAGYSHAVAEYASASAEARRERAEQERTASVEVIEGTNFQIRIEQMPGYLAARFMGVAVPGEGSQKFESIAEHCKLTKNNKLLIDTTGFDVKISIANRFLLGERLMIFTRYGIKVAFVGRPQQLDPGKFAIKVAQNRSVKVDAFTDFQAAEEWLLK